MEVSERVSIIGRNGVGKTTFLKIIAGVETPDTGIVGFNREYSYEFLEQLPQFQLHENVLEAVMNGKPKVSELINRHSELCKNLTLTHLEEDELNNITSSLNEENGWTLDTQAKTILTKLGMDNFESDVMNLSGGQRKRVALARALISDPDLLILDEPTNHLDTASVQWLQDYIQRSKIGLLLVTHDRYFLDAVSNRIVELDRNKLFSFPGNFEKYLERKESMIAVEESNADHLRNRLRTELVWLQRGAKARRSKQQSRIDWIAKMKAEPHPPEEKNIKIEFGAAFLGGIVINSHNISKSIGEKILFNNFSYYAAPGDRIGIIGPNGTGKSTLLNVMAGLIEPDSGSVKIGETVKIGYFRQENSDLDPKKTVIGVLRDIAEYINVGVGKENFLTARELLERFLFPVKQHFALVESLSGGERRRLALLCVLMGNPNVLLLDEPTNDFDIATLSTLEEFLDHFKGTLIVVSHDRSFLDKTVNFIYAFESDGIIKQYPGNYSIYLDKLEEKYEEKQELKIQNQKVNLQTQIIPNANSEKTLNPKITFSEKLELKELEKIISILEENHSELSNHINDNDGTDYKLVLELTDKLKTVDEKLNKNLERWMELCEKE
jgi:ATP-binding cassette subfamily F protein uup